MKYHRKWDALLAIITIIMAPLISCKNDHSVTQDSSQAQKQNPIPEGISITLDTFDVPIVGRLSRVALFRDKFYCMFQTSREYTTRSFKKMIVIDSVGNFVEDVFLPKEMQEKHYFDIFIRDDSLFLEEDWKEGSTFLLKKYIANFEKVEDRNFSIYEDSLYLVFVACFGEWGSSIFFQNRHTKEVFEVTWSSCPFVVNRIADEYVITSFTGHMMGYGSVLRIRDPSRLHKSTLSFDREEPSRLVDGLEVLFDSSAFRIAASFPVKNKLWHLYSTENGAWLGKIEQGKMVPVYQFDFTFYAHYNHQANDGTFVLDFIIPESETEGILTIDNGKFDFYFF